jgi:hypothetical protein
MVFYSEIRRQKKARKKNLSKKKVESREMMQEERQRQMGEIRRESKKEINKRKIELWINCDRNHNYALITPLFAHAQNYSRFPSYAVTVPSAGLLYSIR